jgi:hypothetical protein
MNLMQKRAWALNGLELRLRDVSSRGKRVRKRERKKLVGILDGHDGQTLKTRQPVDAVEHTGLTTASTECGKREWQKPRKWQGQYSSGLIWKRIEMGSKLKTGISINLRQTLLCY